MPEQPLPSQPTIDDEVRQAPRIVLKCPGCGQHAHGMDHFCAACGSELFQPEARSEDARSRRRIHWGWAGVSAVAAVALWSLFQATGHLPGVPQAAPSLAGVQIGDSATAVEHHLGRPERKPTEVFWNSPDGKPHRVALWQYGLVPDSDTPIADLTVTFLDGKVFEVGALDKAYKTSEGLRVGDVVGKASHLYGTAMEEDLVSGLLPIKFLKGGVVVKVVTMPGDDHVLAIGIESPKNLPVTPPAQSDDGAPDPHGGMSLDDQAPTTTL